MSEFESDVLKRKQEEKKRSILERVREKEYIKRCHAVNICPECGKDLENVEDYPIGTITACVNEDCSKKNVEVVVEVIK